jgi:uncharacterized MnhB-related membrane protein
MIWIALVTVLVMVGAAAAAIFMRNMMSAVVAVSVMSLSLSIVFVILRAPDVALTEAVVGAGLSGVLLALALWKTNMTGEVDNENENT